MTQTEQPTPITSYARRVRDWALRTVLGVTISVATLIVCTKLFNTTSLEEFIVQKLYGLQYEQMTDGRKAQALKSTIRIQWERADSVEYNWLKDVYAEQINNARQLLEYEKQPFQVARPVGSSKFETYLVFWPRQCVSSGCRVDMIDYASNRISGTIYPAALKLTNVTLNERPVLADAAGAVYYFDGEKYASR